MTPREASKPTRGGEPFAGLLGGAHEASVRQLVRQVDLEPIGRIVARDIGVEFFRRPIFDLGAEFRLRSGDALRAVDLGEAAGEHRLGLVIERAQKLRLPAVPHARADGADVGRGQDGEKLQPLQRLHHGGEILDRFAVGQIARLRHRRHHQMHLDQPGDQLGVGRRHAEPRAQPPRDARAGDRVILDLPLGDVVQEQRDIEHGAVLRLDRAHQLAGQREFAILAALDLVEYADAAQQMLVHRVVVIHVELHHRHDAAEGADEFAEHAGLVHAPQHGFGVVLRGQDFEEQAVGFLVLAHILVDQLQRVRGGAHGLGMEGEIVLLRQIEQPDQIDRIAAEHVRRARC